MFCKNELITTRGFGRGGKVGRGGSKSASGRALKELDSKLFTIFTMCAPLIVYLDPEISAETMREQMKIRRWSFIIAPICAG